MERERGPCGSIGNPQRKRGCAEFGLSCYSLADAAGSYVFKQSLEEIPLADALSFLEFLGDQEGVHRRNDGDKGNEATRKEDQ